MHSLSFDALEPISRFISGPSKRQVGKHHVYCGSGQAVLVMPAFVSGPESTRALRNLLHHAGFAVHDWGLGIDYGPERGLDRLLRRLEERVIDVFEAERDTVTLIGCDLTGIYAREVAKRTTPVVRQVITIGSPVRVSDPHGRCLMLDTLLGPRSCVDNAKLNRLRQRPPVPCTSIYAPDDELVPAIYAQEPESITSECISVPVHRHSDLMLHPKTIEEITLRIARTDEAWRLFEH